MANNRFITLVSGLQNLVTAISASAGVGDALKIIATNSSGKLDETFLPTGIGADTVSIEAFENLSAGDFVNIYHSGGGRCRKADGSNGRAAHGFVLAAVSSGQNATVYRSGSNDQLSGLTPGTTYWLSTSTPGTAVGTAPTLTTGHIIQVLGVADSAGALTFEFDAPITVG